MHGFYCLDWYLGTKNCLTRGRGGGSDRCAAPPGDGVMPVTSRPRTTSAQHRSYSNLGRRVRYPARCASIEATRSTRTRFRAIRILTELSCLLGAFPPPPPMGNPILRYIEYIIVYACNIRKYTSIYIKGFSCIRAARVPGLSVRSGTKVEQGSSRLRCCNISPSLLL